VGECLDISKSVHEVIASVTGGRGVEEAIHICIFVTIQFNESLKYLVSKINRGASWEF